jgi:hypothetical protein
VKKIWVLFRTERGSTTTVVLCGTVYEQADADRWSDSDENRGAVRLPLGLLAEGETW